MKLVIGLGNPGKKYALNRHNVGYVVIDVLKKANLPKNVVLKKTNVFMNESGKAVKNFSTHYSLLPSALFIIHDDLDIKLGEYKIQKGVGPKDHKGLLSIEHELGTSDFWRIRVGVDNRDPQNRTEGEEYVLQDFDKDELEIVNKVIAKIISDLKQRL
jgi:PTH1 family peptidyl-tRNA hydrolase